MLATSLASRSGRAVNRSTHPATACWPQRVVDRRALVRATAPGGLAVDLTLVMSAFDFDQVWSERRRFIMDGVEVPVARLSHIVRSKTAAGRDKDRLFLATHADTLRQMLRDEEDR